MTDAREMRALTLKQPWAWAVEQGLKDIENRRWPAPKKMIGERFAIHAGLRWDADLAGGFRATMKHAGHGDREVGAPPLGAIVAVATLEACVRSHSSPWFYGPYGFVLADVVKLPWPVACKGALNFWKLPPDVRAKVRSYELLARKEA